MKVSKETTTGGKPEESKTDETTGSSAVDTALDVAENNVAEGSENSGAESTNENVLTTGEKEILEFVRTTGLSMEQLRGFSEFVGELKTTASRLDVVVVGRAEESYDSYTVGQLLSRISDRRKIVKSKGLAPQPVPTTETAPTGDKTVSPTEAMNNFL